LDLQYGEVNADFTDYAYTWLVMGTEDADIVNVSNEMSAAWGHMLDKVAVEGVATKALATVAELTRTR